MSQPLFPQPKHDNDLRNFKAVQFVREFARQQKCTEFAQQKTFHDKELSKTNVEKADETSEIDKMTTEIEQMSAQLTHLEGEVTALQNTLTKLTQRKSKCTIAAVKRILPSEQQRPT